MDRAGCRRGGGGFSEGLVDAAGSSGSRSSLDRPTPAPWWHFYDRYAADPDTTWEHAWQAFAASRGWRGCSPTTPTPGRLTELPTAHLDAFDAGPHAYCVYGWLLAVPAATMLTADGRSLRPISLRYADELDYLRSANEHLNALADAGVLVAVTTK
jgi:hypothetical protein